MGEGLPFKSEIMAEAAIFILVLASVAVGILAMLGMTDISPLWIFVPIVVLLLPGFYAAFTSGPFVPSARKRHQAMLRLAKLTSSDVVYDLGCGDGRLVFAAAKIAKKAIGIELSIPLYLFGVIRSFLSRSKGIIRFGDIWKQDYKDATVIFCYLLPKAMKQFHAEIWPSLKPGTVVISNAFPMHALKPTIEEEKVYLYRKK